MWCYCQSALLIRSLSGRLSYILIHFWQRITALWNANSGHFKGLNTTTLIPSPQNYANTYTLYVNCQCLYWSIYNKLCMMLKLPSQLIYKHKQTTIVIIIIPENCIKHPNDSSEANNPILQVRWDIRNIC